MNFEPNKFFVGLVDFFSILMPGALFIYLAAGLLTRLLPQVDLSLTGTESWVVFLILGYLAGHFAFLLGSAIDDLLYEPIREATPGGQVSRLARGEERSPAWLRRLAQSRWMFGSDADAAVTQAVRIKTRTLRPLGAEKAVNAFQWSKARLSKEHPDGLLTVQGFEAHSKFFRSFVVVLVALVVVFLIQRQFGAALLALLLVMPALWRYVDQRFKSTQQAYFFIITLEAMRTDAENPGRDVRSDGLTHAGGVVFRRADGAPEFLLIPASKNPGEWVLPKGHIEPLEDPRRTAVREVREETGYWASVRAELEDTELGVQRDAPFVRWFLMEALEEEEEEEDEDREPRARDRKWLPLNEAQELAFFTETKRLLVEATAIISADEQERARGADTERQVGEMS